MIHRNKRFFLDYLAGRGTIPVLFEPFLSERHTETLIWRRGPQLWDTPAHTLATLVSQTERTGADMLFYDLRPLSPEDKRTAERELLYLREREPDLGIGVLGESGEDIRVGESAADVLCLFGSQSSDRLPVVRMDGGPEEACRRGDCGWFAPERAEEYLGEWNSRLRILGGLGPHRLSSPAEVYARTEQLDGAYRSAWATGSGGTIGEDEYLGLIAMLGAYARIRDKAS